MQKLFIESTRNTPDIILDPSQNRFMISGHSAPEDVRSLYYPVTEWLKIFVDDLAEGEYPEFTDENPVRFIVYLDYFNSSSAKFLFDIFSELKRALSLKRAIIIEWWYDEEDVEIKEAGEEMAEFSETDFVFVAKGRE